MLLCFWDHHSLVLEVVAISNFRTASIQALRSLAVMVWAMEIQRKEVRWNHGQSCSLRRTLMVKLTFVASFEVGLWCHHWGFVSNGSWWNDQRRGWLRERLLKILTLRWRKTCILLCICQRPLQVGFVIAVGVSTFANALLSFPVRQPFPTW